jgi:hypothetical protein
MQWPKDIVDLFDKALTIEPAEGFDKMTVLTAMLDETVRRALWRVNGDPGLAGAALRTPYTPLGSVTGEGIMGMARSYTIGGEFWGQAVDAFHGYVADNAETIFATFAGQGKAYDHDVGFGPLVRGQDDEVDS